MLAAIAIALHLLATVVWVGGMFFVLVALRPGVETLEPSKRLPLLRASFGAFFPYVWGSIVLLLTTGYFLVFDVYGGFADIAMHINLMQGIGWVMIALFAWLFHGPWLKFKRAVDAGRMLEAVPHLGRIRQIVSINLPLGILVIVIAGGGRFWGAG